MALLRLFAFANIWILLLLCTDLDAQTVADLRDFAIKPSRDVSESAQTNRLQGSTPPPGVPIPGQTIPSDQIQAIPVQNTAPPEQPKTSNLPVFEQTRAMAPAGNGAGIQCQILQNPNGPHSAVLFDPNRQVIAVYQIDSADGSITLMSVRKITWDLQMETYNSDSPAPGDIRSMQPR